MSDAFNPFGGGGGMGGLLGGLQQQMQALQAQSELEEVEGASGGGLVVVRMNGAQQVLSVRIDPKLLADGDAELLEDLVTGAVNQALLKAREAATKSFQAFAGGLPIPGLSSFPGFGPNSSGGGA